MNKSLFLGVGLICLSSWSAPAATLPYLDGFDDPPYVVGETAVGQNGWQLITGTDEGSEIIADPTGSGRGNVLYIKNEAGPNFGNIYQTISGIQPNSLVKVEFDIYGFLADATVMPNITLRDNQNAEFVAVLPWAGGFWQLNNNASYRLSSLPPAVNTWFHLEFLLDFTARTVDFTVNNGVTSASLLDVPFWNENVAANDLLIQFKPYNAGLEPHEAGYVDNISVTAVPEPASLALLSAAGLCAMGLRHIRRRRTV